MSITAEIILRYIIGNEEHDIGTLHGLGRAGKSQSDEGCQAENISIHLMFIP
jgi:hypothetical protein